MRIAIAGGTGFVGSALTTYLASQGHEVFILTRNPNKPKIYSNVSHIGWLTSHTSPAEELGSVDAIINLAGESLNSGRWTEERKKRIINSRINSTRSIIQLIESLTNKPNVLINASAIGFYGNSQSKTFTEDSEAGQGFLAETTSIWEKEASKACDLKVRTVYARFGIILGSEDGALPKMLLPYKFSIGGKVGSGNQWLSWIHITDVVRMIIYAIENKDINGALNVTAPNPKQMNEFGKAIGKALKRPHWIPAPSFALKVLLGEMSTLVLDGQKVLPEKALNHGFSFHYLDLEKALNDLLK